MTGSRTASWSRLRFLAALLVADTLLAVALSILRLHHTLTLPAGLDFGLGRGLAIEIAWLSGLDHRLSVADSFLAPGLATKLPQATDALIALPFAFAVFVIVALALCRFLRLGVVAAAALAGAIVHGGLLLTVLEIPGAGHSSDWQIAWQSSGPALQETLWACVISSAALVLAWRWTAGVFWAGSGLLTIGAVAASLFGPVAGASPAPATLRPPADRSPPSASSNIVLISIDSLRADRLGVYGNPREVSPTIDRLAADGLRFTHAIATSPWTLPSHMSMLTGLDAVEHGVHTERDRLPESVPTVAETLRAHGYQTAGIVSERLVGRSYGFARGFDEFDDDTAVAALEALNEETAPIVTDLALRQIDSFTERPFFLFLHYWDVHYDYAAPEPYRTMFDPDYEGALDASNFIHNDAIHAGLSARDLEHLLALYDGEIRWVDDHLAMLVERLAARDHLASTVFIVTSDHGDEFFEHGGKGHGVTLYREVMQVPLIVSGAAVRAGVVDEAASLTDIAATIYALAGLPAGFAPRNSRNLLASADWPDDRAAYAARCLSYSPSCRFLRADANGWLLASLWPFDTQYFPVDDLRQQRDLSRSADPRVARAIDRMAKSLDVQWRHHRAWPGSRRQEDGMSPAMRERLRALGYDRTE